MLKTIDSICLYSVPSIFFSLILLGSQPYKAERVASHIKVEKSAKINPMLPALIKTESNGNPDALSPRGAAGMFQIMAATALNPGYGVKPLRWWDGKDPRTAPIHEQQRFANELLNAYQAYHKNNPVLAAASYNAGPNKVSKELKNTNGDVDKAISRLPSESRTYVVKVAGYKPEYQVASIWSPVDGGMK